jgi:hypothetical protein
MSFYLLLFVTFSAAGFSGYMLPWGQMSYWAAMVITNLFGGVPVIGDALVVFCVSKNRDIWYWCGIQILKEQHKRRSGKPFEKR